ncbi:aldose 1-epimerase [Caenimonas aquaedulcis]|uniref:Aldose 1-epimerase n=1 Tax=Caenimonas aquaedulcis TaxID=2793270 RepID=A0A931H631_9BURK|nr:aldose 1-epimerase [Caenimonas aquaedulcis]MBG9389142.1 aldose 1-epimerase [Caenimonas aquaedulcis]
MISLEAGALRCEIEPRLGGCICGLWLDGEPVLRSTPASQLSSARAAGSYPLVPFSNRVGGATLQWEGTQHPLVRNNGEEPHAIHGVGWQRPWEILESDATFAMLAYEHRADASWPFAFDSSQTFKLGDGVLDLTLSVTNQSGRPAPAGLGWHPFFTKRTRSHIAFQATGRWDMGEDKLPTQRRASKGLDTDCAFLDVDHCFDGWSGPVVLRDEAMEVRIESTLSRLVVFTNDTRDFVAVEPVSHVNNAMNLVHEGVPAESLGLSILEPGESLSARMSISARRLR